MYATDRFETMILNTFRGQAAAAPAALYLALFLSSPGESGTDGTEVSYSGYARQPVTFSSPVAMNGGTGIQNTAEITFPMTGVNLGTVTHIGVLDSPTPGTGNMLLYGEFTQGLIVEANESPVIVAGEAQWWMTGNMSVAFREKILNILRGQTMPGFAPYMGLCNGNPEEGGAEIPASGTNYVRLALTFAAPEDAGTGQTRILTSGQVSMEKATSNWGTWTNTVVYDAATQGNPAYILPRATPKEIRENMAIIVADGGIALAVN